MLIGEIRMFAGEYAPRGWAFCNGQLLPIGENRELFSILGLFYGGNGRTDFGLPDLRGRVPVHAGAGVGLTPRQLGEKGGSEKTERPVMPVSNDPQGHASALSGSHPSANNMQPYLAVHFMIALQGQFLPKS